MIEIKFIFETIEDAYDFLNKKTELQQQTKPKKENDGRGKSTNNFMNFVKYITMNILKKHIVNAYEN